MSRPKRITLYLDEHEAAIADATAKRLGMSRSQVIRHLIVYQGLCGGSFPLTRRILDLPHDERQRVMKEIVQRTESNDPPKPQRFREWVKETLGKLESNNLSRGADALLQSLVKGEAAR